MSLVCEEVQKGRIHVSIKGSGRVFRSGGGRGERQPRPILPASGRRDPPEGEREVSQLVALTRQNLVFLEC